MSLKNSLDKLKAVMAAKSDPAPIINPMPAAGSCSCCDVNLNGMQKCRCRTFNAAGKIHSEVYHNGICAQAPNGLSCPCSS
jgi:hypothetical protein